MLPRILPRLHRTPHSLRLPSTSRRAYNAHPIIISDPPAHSDAAPSISLAHPKDPGSSSQGSSSPLSASAAQSSSFSSPPPPSQTPEEETVNNNSPVPFVPAAFEHHNDPPEPTNLPSPHQIAPPSLYAHPPFDTHQFFSVLEKTFATSTARSLMRATRALLVDRIGRVRREALTVKDLESVSVISITTGQYHLTMYSKHISLKPLYLSSEQRSPCARVTSRLRCELLQPRYDAK